MHPWLVCVTDFVTNCVGILIQTLKTLTSMMENNSGFKFYDVNVILIFISK
jgi:hypothetical protein